VALKPGRRKTRLPRYNLEQFDPAHAELVASWIRDAREAYWVAPKTPPPVTAEAVRSWNRPGHQQLQLVPAAGRPPVAYGELNVLHVDRGLYWLGHLIVAPRQRGRGIGQALTKALLARAFKLYAAVEVTLVVFPENATARACYKNAGMHEDGWEVHQLAAYRRRVRLLRMTASRRC
jgi:[ribosomal protein S18]-alanine N-acetyltransferase